MRWCYIWDEIKYWPEVGDDVEVVASDLKMPWAYFRTAGRHDCGVLTPVAENEKRHVKIGDKGRVTVVFGAPEDIKDGYMGLARVEIE